MAFPQVVVIRMVKYNKDGTKGPLLSIKVLEFVTDIINYCAATQIMGSIDHPFSDDPHPILLNITDNKSALNWTLHSCQGSPAARLLARLFFFLPANRFTGRDQLKMDLDQ